MLHTDKPNASTACSVDVCDYFPSFFVSKINKLKIRISELASGHPIPPSDPQHFGPKRDTLKDVTATEVTKIINFIPIKSSSLDCVQTSIIKAAPVIFGPRSKRRL